MPYTTAQQVRVAFAAVNVGKGKHLETALAALPLPPAARNAVIDHELGVVGRAYVHWRMTNGG